MTSYTYDVRSNRTAMTNALGNTFAYAYDKADRMITVTDPEQKAASVVYDMVGNIESITTPGERTTGYGYDGNYNVSSVTDPMGYVYAYSYDKDDRLIGTLDPLGQTTAYAYDKANRLVSYTNKRGLTESYTYDPHGNLLSHTDTYGLTTTYVYDLKNRLTGVTDAMGSTAFYTYDVMDNLTGVTDYLGRGTQYTYDLLGNLTGITDAAGRTEQMTYDIAGRLISYTSNGGNTITYDYDKLDSLVEKAYTDALGEESAEPAAYAYDALGERVAMYDSTGDTEYTYDSLGRITSVTTYRTPGAEGGYSHEDAQGDTVTYTYDGADNLAAITYPDGTRVCYEYDLNDNLIKVTDREGLVTTYVYDAINRITEIHRPNGISTYNTYNGENQITELTNICDDCGWVVSRYAYTYDERGFITAETAVESLAGYAYDDKHDGKHEDGRHDDLYPHGSKHAKHDKDAAFAYQIVETDRTFTYDDAGKLLSATETEDNYGTYVFTYEYDLTGNRTAVIKTDEDGEIAESRKYVYNESNQLVSVELFDGKKTTSVSYTYDADGNLISETGRDGTDKVELTYTYTVENRLEAVYDGKELLMAAAYDGDGNRVFQLNYNLHTDEDWKGNSGNGNGSNKDNAGSGSSGTDSSGSSGDGGSTDSGSGDDSGDDDSSSSGNNGNGNGNSNGNNGNGNNGNNGNGNGNKGNTGNSSANNGKGGNGKNNGNTGNNGNGNGNSVSDDSSSETEDDTDGEDTGVTEGTTGNGNATNAETNNSQNQCGILFPIDSETSDTESYLISLIKTSGKEKNYELIEYVNDVNREYTEVLAEQNMNGALDTAYVYGAAIGTGSDRLSLDRFDGSTGYYLYDPRGSVTGITNEEGQVYQSYRYSVFGEITFGAPQYENEYTYNGESYNPNIESQYLRARYYCVVTAAFLTEDSYLGTITEPLTLNRYNYCVSSPLNYVDPSGNEVSIWEREYLREKVYSDKRILSYEKAKAYELRVRFLSALDYLDKGNANVNFVLSFDYNKNMSYVDNIITEALLKNAYEACDVSEEFRRYYEIYGYISKSKYLINKSTLTNIGWKGGMSEVDIYTMNAMLNKYKINTTERLRHFFTQVLMESGNGMYVREGEYLLNYGITQEEYEARYDKRKYKYIHRGVGYIQTTFAYNHESFAVYLLMTDYPELELQHITGVDHNAAQVRENYENSIIIAKEAGIDVTQYESIAEKGTDYIAKDFSWEITGYWWETRNINGIIDTFTGSNSIEVDKITAKVNKDLSPEKYEERRTKYEEIMGYIR